MGEDRSDAAWWALLIWRVVLGLLLLGQVPFALRVSGDGWFVSLLSMVFTYLLLAGFLRIEVDKKHYDE